MKVKLAIGVDLSWAGDTGVVAIACKDDGSLWLFRSTVIHPPKYKGKVTDEVRITRAYGLMHELQWVFGDCTAIAKKAETVLVYEDSTKWLLAAAKAGSKTRRPVTRVSLLGSVFPLACLWIAIGRWRWIKGVEVKVVGMDAQKARRQFGVQGWCNLAHVHFVMNRLLEEKEFDYDDLVKAQVGAAVWARLQEEEIDYLPSTDHEADAALMALVALDDLKMEV